MPHDFYALLGLPRNATTQQIRDRFRELARERHPDRFRAPEDNRTAEREFQELTEAFNALVNPERRRRYDLDLVRPDRGGADPRAQLSRAYFQRGLRAYRDGSYPQAAENLERAVREEPGNAQAWHYLALALSQHALQLPRAREAIQRACALDPVNSGSLKLAGQLFARGGLVERAVKYYQDALACGGEDPEVRRSLDELERSAKKSSGRRFGGEA